MGGAGRTCRGEAFPKTAAAEEIIATHNNNYSADPVPSRLIWQVSKPVQHAIAVPIDAAVRACRSKSRLHFSYFLRVCSASGSSPSLIPRGKFQSEVDG